MNSPDRDIPSGEGPVDARGAQRFASAARAREAMIGGTTVPMSEQTGPLQRPWELVVAAVLGALAPVFVLLALLILTFTGGRTVRTLAWMLHGVGEAGEVAGASVAGDIAEGLADGFVVIGALVGVIVVIGFAAYAWRVAVGRGRARWAALCCLLLGFVVITPLSPLLIGGFLLFGILSVVFAFLPRSSAWYADRRGRAPAQIR